MSLQSPLLQLGFETDGPFLQFDVLATLLISHKNIMNIEG